MSWVLWTGEELVVFDSVYICMMHSVDMIRRTLPIVLFTQVLGLKRSKWQERSWDESVDFF